MENRNDGSYDLRRVLSGAFGPVTLGKVERDALKMRKHSACVIVLGSDGEIVEEIIRDPRGDPRVVRVVTVLAPTTVDEVSLKETVVLEIGFSRTRPYTQTERRNGKRYFFIKERKRVRVITPFEYAIIQTRIFEIMRDLVVRLREEWKTQDAWRIGRKNVEYERGIFFSVHRSDQTVLAHVLLADIRFRRREGYFRTQARRFILKLGRYRKGYTDKQYRNLEGVQQSLFLLERLRHPAKYVRELIPVLSKPVHAHLLRIAGMFPRSVVFEKSDEETLFLDRFKEESFVEVSGFGLCITRRHKRTFHAKDCVVAEGLLTKRYRTTLPLFAPNIDDDVPF